MYIYYVHLLYCCTQKYVYMYIRVHATCILYILAYCVYMHVLLNLLSYIIFSTWCRVMLVHKRYTYRYVHTYICAYNAVICWSDGYYFLRLRCFLSSLLQWQDNTIMVVPKIFCAQRIHCWYTVMAESTHTQSTHSLCMYIGHTNFMYVHVCT